jgi:acyl-CoA reductase-like NAD-dependent aldehyde dehydrogenase
MKVDCLEAFAPLVTVSSFSSFEQAIERINDSSFGLQTGIFTNDLKAVLYAFDQLDVGGVIINDTPTFRVDHMPYGGVKNSGFGREGLKYAIEEMTEIKLLTLPWG